MLETHHINEEHAAEFERAADRPQVGPTGELFAFLAQNKKWWLAPIVVVLFVAGLLILLGSSAAGPFIYPLF